VESVVLGGAALVRGVVWEFLAAEWVKVAMPDEWVLNLEAGYWD
jgi:hypothetical protein